MCDFYSGVTTLCRDEMLKHYILRDGNPSHQDIIEHHKLKDTLLSELARWEFVPPNDDYSQPLDKWTLILDEHRKPGWWNDGVEMLIREWIGNKPLKHILMTGNHIVDKDYWVVCGNAVVNQSGGYCSNVCGNAVVNQSGGDCWNVYDNAIVNQSGGDCRNVYGNAVVNQSGGDCWNVYDNAVVNQSGGDCWVVCGNAVVNQSGGYCRNVCGNAVVNQSGGDCWNVYGNAVVNQSGGDCWVVCGNAVVIKTERAEEC